METKTQHFRRWVTLATVVVAGFMIFLALHAGRRAFRVAVSDFQAYYTAATEMRAGRDPYAPNERPYLYPPLIAFLCMPLTSLPIDRAAMVYLPALLAAVLLSLYLAPKVMLDRLDAKPDANILSQVILITMVLMLDRLRADTQMFQVNTLMLALFTLALYWLDRKPWLAGAALGLALNIKGQSIVMLPYLLIRRRWSAAAAMVGSTIAFALLPGAVVGWSDNLRNLGRVLGGLQTLAGTQTPERSTTHLADVTVGYSISVTSGVARILKQAGLSEWLWPTIAVLVVALFIFVFWAYRRNGIPLLRWPGSGEQNQSPWRSVVAIEWACLMIAILVFNPQTNTRHLVLTLVPMALAVAALRKPVPRIPWRLFLLGAALLFAGLTLPPGSRRIAWLVELNARWFPIGGPCWLLLMALGFLLVSGLKTARAITDSKSQGNPAGPGIS